MLGTWYLEGELFVFHNLVICFACSLAGHVSYWRATNELTNAELYPGTYMYANICTSTRTTCTTTNIHAHAQHAHVPSSLPSSPSLLSLSLSLSLLVVRLLAGVRVRDISSRSKGVTWMLRHGAPPKQTMMDGEPIVESRTFVSTHISTHSTCARANGPTFGMYVLANVVKVLYPR